MSDRELLELAAKGAEIAIQRCRLDDPMWRDMLLVDRKHGNGDAIGWNPLTDDGDALRLAVTLGMQITVGAWAAHIHTDHGAGPEERESFENNNNNPWVATRRAIVRAAAEIGRKRI